VIVPTPITQLTILSRADVPGGTRADGGNTTAANRLLGAIEWLATQKPGIYDGLEVPLHTRCLPRSSDPLGGLATRPLGLPTVGWC
jgi:hypothetical protein